MNAKLLKTQLAIDSCRQHLESSQAWGTDIESYLSQHILVVLCADIQQVLYTVLEERADAAKDIELKHFAVTTGKRVLRSVGKGEIANFVGFFGEEAKAYLNTNIDDREVTLYNNAVSSRHDIAHKTGSNITFRELSDILEAAKKIINAVESAISSERGKLKGPLD
jgi:hypothetical protein